MRLSVTNVEVRALWGAISPTEKVNRSDHSTRSSALVAHYSEPPVQPWCHRDHEAGESADGAGFLCIRTIVDDGSLDVDLQQLQWGDERVDVIETDPPEVHFNIQNDDASRSFDEAIALAERFTIAVHKAKAIRGGASMTAAEVDLSVRGSDLRTSCDAMPGMSIEGGQERRIVALDPQLAEVISGWVRSRAEATNSAALEFHGRCEPMICSQGPARRSVRRGFSLMPMTGPWRLHRRCLRRMGAR